MDRTANAVWHGGLKDGNGKISTQSGVLKDSQYSFGTRFADGIGTNPEELIAAAHAGCFTMALSAQLSTANLPPASIETKATVTFDKTDAGPTITKIHHGQGAGCGQGGIRQGGAGRQDQLPDFAPLQEQH
jgi:lipoyl-dependent peroxiredoxin